MALIDQFIKKKDKINVGQSNEPQKLLIDKFVTPSISTPSFEEKKQSPTILDRIKGIGKGVAQFAARTGVEAANLASSTLDFAADFLSGQIEKQIRRTSATPGAIAVPIGRETKQRSDLANRWKSFYSSTGGELTEKLKSFTQNLREVDFIKPSEEWVNASTEEKFTERLPETILNIGPGVVSSLGLYALNPVAGFVSSVGSVADELKTIAIENGVNEERAELLGLGTGLFVGWLDKIVPDEVFSPQQKKTFISGFAKRILKTGLKEAGTEVLQEDVQLLAEATVREDITTDEVVSRNLMAALGGVLGGVGAETTVGFVNGIGNGDIGGLEEDYTVETEVQEQEEGQVVEVKNEEEEIEQSVDQEKKTVQARSDEKVSPEETIVKETPRKKEITENQIKNTKDIKETKKALRSISKDLSNAVIEAEARAVIAKDKRFGMNVENINKLKLQYSRNKAFQDGDFETISKSKSSKLVHSVVENVQEFHPEMSDDEALEYALNLPTKAEESARTPDIRELEKKNKKLSKYLDLLKSRQSELKIQEDEELSREWTQALAIQERLEKLIRVPSSKLPVGQGKEKVSRLQARLKGALDKTSQEDIDRLGLTTFRQSVNDDQIARALEYAKNNPEEAVNVAMGQIDPPDGLLTNSVYSALVQLGTEDTDLATKVASLGSTRFGQEIQILKTILADNPVVMMQEIVSARIEAYEKKTGKKARDRIKKEVKRIRNEVKAPGKSSWDSFLDSIKC